MDKTTFRPATAAEVRQRWADEREEALREAQVPAPPEHEESTVATLEDEDVFSVDGGRTWYVCCLVMFDTVAVYVTDDRDPDEAPTIRVDADEDAACLVWRRR